MGEIQGKLRRTSKALAVLMKIGYILVIVAACGLLCCLAVAVLFPLGYEGGYANINVVAPFLTETKVTAATIIAGCAFGLTQCGFLFAILLIAYRLFHEIAADCMPFCDRHVVRIRNIGILTIVMSAASPLLISVICALAGVRDVDISFDLTGVLLGIVMLCLALIFRYGCALQQQSDETL